MCLMAPHMQLQSFFSRSLPYNSFIVFHHVRCYYYILDVLFTLASCKGLEDFPMLKEANEWRHACTRRNQNTRPTRAARKEKLLCWPQKNGYFLFIAISETCNYTNIGVRYITLASLIKSKKIVSRKQLQRVLL